MREEIKDLTTSKGWLYLCQALEKRKVSLISELINQPEMEQVFRIQSAIRTLEYVVKLPHELIQGNQQEE